MGIGGHALCVVATVPLGVPLCAQDIEQGLVFYYSFDDCENLGRDDSGAGFEALPQGDVSCIGTAAAFDGNGDALRMGLQAGTYDAVTVSVWVNLWAVGGDFLTIMNCDGWEAQDLHFQIVGRTGAVRFSVNGNAPHDLDSSFRFTSEMLNQWFHVAAVYESATGAVSFYINGQLDSERAYTGANPIILGPLTIGSWNGSSRFFNGLMDEVRVYDRALSPEEIEELSEAEVGGDFPPQFVGVPGEDTAVAGTTYTRRITVRGHPQPTVTVVEPEGGTISQEGLFSYDVPDPAPESFTVTLEASNGVGDPARASWVVYCRTGELKGLWCLEEGAGLVAEDSAGESDAELRNMDESAWVEGEISDTALSLSGQGQFLLLAPEGEEPIDFHQDFTWAAWIQTFTGGTILSKSPTLSAWARGAMALFVRDGFLTFDVGWVGFVASAAPVNDGSWHHVALTVKFNVDGVNDEVHLSIDGVEDAMRNNWDLEMQGPPPGDFKAGFASSNFPQTLTFFEGVLDEIRVWDYALSADQILQAYEQPGEGCGGGPVSELFVRGDVNLDTNLNIADAVSLLTHLFAGTGPLACPDGADANDDGGVNIADAVSILSHLFGGAGPLPEPFEQCGSDPSADTLGPCSYPPCQAGRRR